CCPPVHPSTRVEPRRISSTGLFRSLACEPCSRKPLHLLGSYNRRSVCAASNSAVGAEGTSRRSVETAVVDPLTRPHAVEPEEQSRCPEVPVRAFAAAEPSSQTRSLRRFRSCAGGPQDRPSHDAKCRSDLSKRRTALA